MRIPFLISLCFIFCFRLGAIDIVKNSKAYSAIIIPENALWATRLAANELQYHLKLATGVELKICFEREKPDNFPGLIYVGPCRATLSAGIAPRKPEVNWFAARTVKSDLFLCGDDQDPNPQLKTFRQRMRYSHTGSAFAVYELLERELNVRWLWPGKLGTMIKNKSDLSFQSINFFGRPKYISSWFPTRLKNSNIKGWSSSESKTRFEKETYLWLRRHRFNLANCIMPDHSYGDYWKRFGKTHPEWFNLLPNGKRQPLSGDSSGHAVTMCISNPEVIKQKIADWTNPHYLNWFKKKHPGLRYIVASENDSPAMCTCKNCRAWDTPDSRFDSSKYWAEGKIPTRKQRFHDPDLSMRLFWYTRAPQVSDRYARYYLNLYNEAKKVNPDVILAAYAYNNYSPPPRKVKLNDHIQLSYVPREMYPPTEKGQKVFEADWRGWTATGAKLVLRPNLTGNGHNLPISYVKWAYDSITFANRYDNMIGIMFDSLLGEWGTQGFSYYVIARLNVDPKTPLKQIFADYCAAFGPAAAAVEKYWQYWENVSRQVDVKAFRKFEQENSISWKKWLPIAPLVFTPQIMREGRALLESAKAVKGLNKVQQQRLDFLETGLQNAEKTLETLKLWNDYKLNKSTVNRNHFADSLKDLYAFRRKIDINCVSDVGYLYLREGWTWDKKMLRYASVKLPESGMVDFNCRDSFPAGRLNSKVSGWALAHDDGKKYRLLKLGKQQVLCLAADSRPKTNCLISCKWFNEPVKDFTASVNMAWSADTGKNEVLSRILFHNAQTLWKGIEIGFISKNGKVFPGYRHGSAWRSLPVEMNPDELYRFAVKVHGKGKLYNLQIYNAKGKLIAGKDNIIPHGLADVNMVSALVASLQNGKKSNVLYINSIIMKKSSEANNE